MCSKHCSGLNGTIAATANTPPPASNPNRKIDHALQALSQSPNFDISYEIEGDKTIFTITERCPQHNSPRVIGGVTIEPELNWVVTTHNVATGRATRNGQSLLVNGALQKAYTALGELMAQLT